MKLSIVTVCYNAEATIGEAFESVLKQEYQDYEYLVIDGKSSDKTVLLAEEYRKKFEANGIPFHVVSEKDHGIYDAMNKAIAMAKGTWIYFLNADDRLYDTKVLKKVFSRQLIGVDVIYGRVYKCVGTKMELRSHGNIEEIVKEMPFCHQGAFTKTEWMKKFLFDQRFSICADYNFMLKMYLQGRCFQKIEDVVACFSAEGVSSRNYLRMMKEGYQVRKENGVLSWKDRIYFQCYWYPANWYHIQKEARKKGK